ncbi:hypothetical protein B0H19DRAFT_1303896 [Mycena capillaripes]|nr:hypothetical protein B0H19DRAFT_1303896 [Mycena capillaripes]
MFGQIIPSSSPDATIPTPPETSDSDDKEDDEQMNDGEGDMTQLDDLPSISLEDLLPDPEEDQAESLDQSPTSSLLPSASAERSQNNNWLEYKLEDGATKRLHKASILSSLFNSDYRQLSDGRKPKLNHQEFSGGHSFNVGDIGVGLIRTGNFVSAAVVKITVVMKDKCRLAQIDTEELGSMESTVTVTAQPLEIKWLWTGDDAKFEPLKGPQSSVESGTRKALTLDPLVARHMQHVWAVANDDLTAVVSTLYSSLDTETVLKLILKHGKSNSFPYCHIFIKPEDARGHVGGHIFKSINGVAEPNLFEQVHPTNPCGFCGRGSCDIDLPGLPTSRHVAKTPFSLQGIDAA